MGSSKPTNAHEICPFRFFKSVLSDMEITMCPFRKQIFLNISYIFAKVYKRSVKMNSFSIMF